MDADHIVIELEPTERERLDAESLRRGVAPGKVLQDMVRRLPDPTPRKNMMEALAALREMRERLPEIPQETFCRVMAEAKADRDARPLRLPSSGTAGQPDPAGPS